MNEEAIQDAFTLFTGGGYKGDIQGFKTLISSNDEARNDAFSLFAKSGYKGDVQGFSNLMGVSTKKDQVDSTVSPSVLAQDKLGLDIPEPQKETILDSVVLTKESEDGKIPQLISPIEPIDEIPIEFNSEISTLYDGYKQAGVIKRDQALDIVRIVEDQKKGKRGIFETITAMARGVIQYPALASMGNIIPIFNFDDPEDLIQKRTLKNRTDYLRELPDEDREQLESFAVNRSLTLSKENTNVLAESKILEEKGKSLLNTLQQAKKGIEELASTGEIIPPQALETYEEIRQEALSIMRNLSTNADIIENNNEDIGDFNSEIDLLKRNYSGVDFLKRVWELETTSLITNLGEAIISIPEAAAIASGVPKSTIESGTFRFPEAEEKLGEIRRGIEDIKEEELAPLMSVQDIESVDNFAQWMLEQITTQINTVVILAGTGGTAGLGILGASSFGAKAGEMKDSGKFNRSEIYLASAGFGALEILTERITLGILSKGKRTMQSISRTGLRDNFRTGALRSIVVNPAVKEGSAETLNTLGQNIIDIVGLGDKDKHITDGLIDSFASGAFLGQAMVSAPATVGMTAKIFSNAQVRNSIKKRRIAIESLLTELEDKDLNIETKELLNNKINDLSGLNELDIIEIFDNVSKLSTLSIQELINIDKKNNKLIQQVKDIIDSDLTDDVRNTFLADYKKEADALKAAKDKILQEDGDKQKPEATEEPTVKEPIIPEEAVIERGERVEEVPREDAVQPSVAEPTERVRGDVVEVEEVIPEPPTVAVEEFTKIDLSDKLGLDKALKTLNKWDKDLGDFGKETIGVNIPVVIAQGAVKAMKAAIKTAKTGADIISAGINHLRETNWYKGLNQKDKTVAEDNLINNISSISEPTKIKEEVPLRTKIEEKVSKKIKEGVSEKKIVESFEDSKERMIAKDIFARKEPLDIEEAKRLIIKIHKKSKSKLQQTEKTGTRIERAFNKFMQFGVDRQFLPKKLLKKAGGQIVTNYIITSKGAGGYAKHLFDKAYKNIYKGLSDKNLDILDKVITLKRFISIDKNRAKRSLPDVVHPDFINKQSAEAALEGLKEELGEKDFKDLEKRATTYFTEYKDNLKRLVDSGIISKESGETFLDVDYQPRVYLQFLNQTEQDLSILEKGAKETASLSSPQIRALEEGSDDSLLMDSAYLLGRSLNITAKAIAMNETTNKFVDFYTKRIVEIDKLKSKDNPTKQDLKDISNFDKLSKHIKTPKEDVLAILGFKPQFYYIDGVKKRIFFKDTFHNQYNDLVKGIVADSRGREVVSTLSLTSVIKTIATGNNPTFFLTNTPRDLVFVSTFSPEYGSFVPLNMVNASIDAFKGIKDIRSDSKNYENFVKHGGMLDFLHRQGQFKETTTSRKIIKKLFSNIQLDNMKSIGSFLSASKIQMWSEMGFRMGIFNRNVSNRFKELGVKTEEALIEKYGDKSTQMLKDIYVTATASARSITDFSQGGVTAKDIDLIIPYFNASIQGTRAAVESLADRPFETSVRMVQSAAIMSAIPASVGLYVFSKAFRGEDDEDKELSATELYLKAREGLSEYEKTNYMIFFTGERNEDGEFKYRRIAKAHFLTPIASYATDLQENIMRGVVGQRLKNRKDIISSTLLALEKNVSPAEMSISGNITKTPLIKAALTYQVGYDFFREQDLSHLKGKVLPQVEGFENKNIESFYKNLGEKWDISPARMKGAVEGIITTPSTSPFIGVLYGGLEHLVGGDFKKGVFNETMLKSISGRIFKETSEFNRRKKLIPDNELAEMQKRDIFTKEIIKDMTRKLLSKEVTPSELGAAIEERAEGSPFEVKRIVNIMKSVIKNPKTLPYVYEIKFSPPRVRAVMLVTLFGDTLLDETEEISKFNKALKNELFSNKVLNSETLIEYNNLIKAKESN